MGSDINDAAANVIELTNKVGATAVDMQHASQAARTARHTAAAAARNPGRLAAVGAGLLVTAAVLVLRRERLAGQAWRGAQTASSDTTGGPEGRLRSAA